ncbi:MAG TPA: glycosyltransferase family 2 protein [Steroidobacteraceae bacterium]|jgi:glycosyltransferase involved in cell wall biosynthesis
MVIFMRIGYGRDMQPDLEVQSFVAGGAGPRKEIEPSAHELERVLSVTQRVAVLIPCFNEAAAIGTVVGGFRAALPAAEIYVYDNNSTDQTGSIAAAAGATVRKETLQGKGNVVRRMFADIEADIYVMVDGDSTYDPSSAAAMIRLLLSERLDMVVGTRIATEDSAYRHGHVLGNQLLTRAVSHLFGSRFSDMLSGYRVFSRRFVKSFPAMSSGFETETELTIHALELSLPVAEVPTRYGGRVAGSASKLQTYADGLRILRLIVVLYKNERPLRFFSGIAAALSAIALFLGMPIVLTFIETGLVPRQPTAILATGLVLLSALSFVTGLILDTVTRGRREMRRLAYLSLKPPP